jgi:hypothetical protein
MARRQARRENQTWDEWVRLHRWDYPRLPDAAFASEGQWLYFLDHGRLPGRGPAFSLDQLNLWDLRAILHQFTRNSYRAADSYLVAELRRRVEVDEEPWERFGRMSGESDVMTEGAWLTTSNPQEMLTQLGRDADERKLRLFGCACCRRLFPMLSDARSREAVEVMEQRADGLVSMRQLRKALGAAEQAEVAARDRGRMAARAVAAAWSTTEHSRSAAEHASTNPKGERRAQTDLLRDVFGNPFRGSSIDVAWLAWNDGCISQMARSIYDDRRFSDMPILADALEEAGCTNADMLSHARSRQTHVCGCWVLDCLLGTPLVEEAFVPGSVLWTIEGATEGEARSYVRDGSRSRHFAEVALRIDPTLRSGPVVFLNATAARLNAHPWLRAIESGIRQVLEEHARSEMRAIRGMRVALIDFVEHPVDSTPHAFEQAAALALAKALARTRFVPCE